VFGGGLCLLLACAEAPPAAPVDQAAELRVLLAAAGAAPIERPPAQPAALVALGKALFFDKILSGDRNVGCSTCHNPTYHTDDQLSLSIGTGGRSSGGARQLGTGAFTSRGSMPLFNVGHPAWRTLFWDGRVERVNGELRSPAGVALPQGLSGPLAAQALFPLAARVEMRGHPGVNELAAFADSDLTGIWRGIVSRVQAIPGYDTLFAAAYPAVAHDSLTIAHLANAIAAYEAATWPATESAYDRYLRGDTLALSPEARRGAILFFGRARCSACHRGELLSDQQFHNIGVPPLGPGLATGIDIGRAAVTGDPADRYAFRTPALRNVTLTGPFMHNGVYATLEQIIDHYENAETAAGRLDPAVIDSRLRSTLDQSPATLAELRATLDTTVRRPLRLSTAETTDLIAFLFALTDPASVILLRDVPASVPSGLPVFDR
jgi:cytochrome c peroxidase